jgi:hypothetical protein
MMTKMLMIFSIIFFVQLSFISLHGMKTKTFDRYGVQFNYPDYYTLRDNKKQKYHEIFLKQQGIAHISVQIFRGNLNKAFRRGFIGSFSKTLESSGFENIKREKVKKNIKVKVSNDEYTNLEAVKFEMSFIHENGNKIDTSLFFFSYGGRGYTIGFSSFGSKTVEGDFKIIQRSFTITR